MEYGPPAEVVGTITIYGCGALGGRLAVQFHEAGVAVQCLSRPGAHLESIKAQGLLFRDAAGRTRRVPLQVFDDPSGCPPAELLVILVKSWQNADIAGNLPGLLKADGFMLTLQNGLGNVEVLRDHAPVGRLLAGSITYGAYRPGPGAVSSGGDGLIRFAPVTPGADARGALGLFREAGFNVELDEEPWRAIWGKVIVNAGINPVAALTRYSNAQTLASPFARKVVESLCREAVSVANASGLDFDPDEEWAGLLEVLRLTAGTKPSMLQDIEAGNRTEIEAISGEIMRRGAAAGLETPFTTTLYNLVKALEAGSAAGFGGR